MNVFVKTDLARIRSIVKRVPEEVEVNLTPTLEKKLIKSQLIRYNQTDYICRRIKVDNLVLQSVHTRTTLIMQVSDYWVRCERDPRYCSWPKPRLVFKIL